MEQSNFTFIFGRNATGGNIGNTSALKFKTCICNINVFSDNRNSRRTDFADFGSDEVQNNIDIMNHKVKDYADVGTAILVDTQAVRFDEHRLLNDILQSNNCRIKSFKVPHLNDQTF